MIKNLVFFRVSFFHVFCCGTISEGGFMLIARYLLVLFCFVGFASEREPLLSCNHDEKALLQKKMHSALSDETGLWVLVVQKGERHTAWYNLRDENICCTWEFAGDNAPVTVILPAMEAVQHAVMPGFTQRRGSSQQKNFSVKLQVSGDSVDTQCYKPTAFFSRPMRLFLTSFCPKLYKKGKAKGDSIGKFLADDVLQSFNPSEDKWMRFFIKTVSNAANAICATNNSDPSTVFMPVPGVGVLQGCAAPHRFWHPKKETSVMPESFFSQRLLKIGREVLGQYSYSPEKWKSCLDYEES